MVFCWVVEAIPTPQFVSKCECEYEQSIICEMYISVGSGWLEGQISNCGLVVLIEEDLIPFLMKAESRLEHLLAHFRFALHANSTHITYPHSTTLLVSDVT